MEYYDGYVNWIGHSNGATTLEVCHDYRINNENVVYSEDLI